MPTKPFSILLSRPASSVVSFSSTLQDPCSLGYDLYSVGLTRLSLFQFTCYPVAAFKPARIDGKKLPIKRMMLRYHIRSHKILGHTEMFKKVKNKPLIGRLFSPYATP